MVVAIAIPFTPIVKPNIIFKTRFIMSEYSELIVGVFVSFFAKNMVCKTFESIKNGMAMEYIFNMLLTAIVSLAKNFPLCNNTSTKSCDNGNNPKVQGIPKNNAKNIAFSCNSWASLLFFLSAMACESVGNALIPIAVPIIDNGNCEILSP